MLPLFSFHCCPNLPAAQWKVCAMAVAGWASCYPMKPQSSISNLQCGRALSNAMTSEITKVKQLNSFIYFFIFSPFLVSIFFFLSLGKRREASQFVLQFISTGLPLCATGHPSKLMQFFCKELLKSGWKRDCKMSACQLANDPASGENWLCAINLRGVCLTGLLKSSGRADSSLSISIYST